MNGAWANGSVGLSIDAHTLDHLLASEAALDSGLRVLTDETYYDG